MCSQPVVVSRSCPVLVTAYFSEIIERPNTIPVYWNHHNSFLETSWTTVSISRYEYPSFLDLSTGALCQQPYAVLTSWFTFSLPPLTPQTCCTLPPSMALGPHKSRHTQYKASPYYKAHTFKVGIKWITGVLWEEVGGAFFPFSEFPSGMMVDCPLPSPPLLPKKNW